MKTSFSFSRLLKSDKLMLIVSIVLAIVLWFAVISGPANIQDRPITVTVTVDLTNTYAHQSGLRVLGNDTFEVKVNVSGTWSVISKLSADDVRVRPDLSSITGAGNVEVPLTASRNSLETDYDILSISPRSVTVVCDYWQEGSSYKVNTDVSALTATPSGYQIGEPVLDTTAFPEGKLTVDGPQSIVSQIDSLVAKVPAEEVLSELKQYSVPVTALDANGEELDLTHCIFREIPNGMVVMTVPVWERRHVTLGYSLKNAPSGVNTKKMLLIEPSGLDVLGPTAELDVLEEQLKSIGTVDFASLSLTNTSVAFPLTVPSTVRVIDMPEEVKVSLNAENLSEKTLSMVPTVKNVEFKGLPKSMKATIPQQTLDKITLIGDSAAINSVTFAALTLEIDLGEAPKSGTKQYYAKVIVNSRDDVWAHYCEDEEGIKVFVTLS